ncbi:hypothetical protein EPUL_005000, partial [Erysiphe pulchra]
MTAISEVMIKISECQDLMSLISRSAHAEALKQPNQTMSVMLGVSREMKGKVLHGREKKVGFEDDEKKVTLESFLNIGDAKKRAGPINIEDLLNKEEQGLKLRKRNRRSREKKRLAEDIKMEVSLMDLFQMSLDLSKAFRALSTRVNIKLEKRKYFTSGRLNVSMDRIDGIRNNYNSESLLSRERTSISSVDKKAFRVDFQNEDFEGLTMNVADETSAELTHYAEFEIGVLGVWRRIEAFVRPFNANKIDEIHLLLGMSWLHAVDAKILIRESIIEIGDTQKGKKVVKVEGPQFIESELHELVLCPKEDIKSQPVEFHEASSEDSDDSLYDSDDVSDESFGDANEGKELIGQDKLKIAVNADVDQKTCCPGEVMEIDLGSVLPEDNEHADNVINFIAKRIDERQIALGHSDWYKDKAAQRHDLGKRGQNEY